MACKYELPDGRKINEKEFKAYLLDGGLNNYYKQGLLGDLFIPESYLNVKIKQQQKDTDEEVKNTTTENIPAETTESKTAEKETIKSKLNLSDEKVKESLADFKDAFKEWKQIVKGGNIGVIDKSTEIQGRMISAGIDLIKAYTAKGIYKFADIANDLAINLGDKSNEFLSALKQAYGAISFTDVSNKFDKPAIVNSFQFDKEEKSAEQTIKKSKERDWSKFKIKIAGILESSNPNITAEDIINILGEKSQEGKEIIEQMVSKKRDTDTNLLAEAKKFVNDLFDRINKGKDISKTAINIVKSDLSDIIDLIDEKFIIYDVINNSKLEKFADEAVKLFGDNYKEAIQYINQSGKLSAAKPILLAKIAQKLNEEGKGKEAANIMERLLDESNMAGRMLQVFKKVNEILNVRGTPEYKTAIAKKIVEKAKQMSERRIAEIESESERKLGESEEKINEYKKQLSELRDKSHQSTLSKIKDKMASLINNICKTRTRGNK